MHIFTVTSISVGSSGILNFDCDWRLYFVCQTLMGFNIT